MNKLKVKKFLIIRNIPSGVNNRLGYLCLLLLLLLPFQVKATAEDSVRISLLTCSPGQEIYSLFGHTAIRYEDPARGIDRVFNYGMFSFDTPNFVWRFVKGETDYQLGICDYVYFEAEYAMRGSSVYQQTLNLLPEEKQLLLSILAENYLPENRTYRYNFFFDNCTTRARDKIQESIQGKLEYNKDERRLSYRDIVHQYTKGYPWSEFGIDLCLGSKADELADYRQKMFAPFYLLHAADSAMIIGNADSTRAFVLESVEVVKASDTGMQENGSGWMTPMMSALLVLIVTLMVSGYGVRKNKMLWGWDILLFGAAGLAGCVIAFLVFFSVHPAVSPNYLLFVLNPIHLFYLPFMIYRTVKRKIDIYHWLNLVVLTLFMLFWWVIPQKINLAVLPLALSLLLRSATHLYLMHKRKQ